MQLNYSDFKGNYLDLDHLISAEGLVLPEKFEGSLYLDGISSAEGLVLPQKIGGSLSLDGISSAEKEQLKKKYPKINII